MDDDDNRCLVDVNSRPRLIECSYAKAKRMKLHWQFSQVTALGGESHSHPRSRCTRRGASGAQEVWRRGGEVCFGNSKAVTSGQFSSGGFTEHLLCARGFMHMNSLTLDIASEGSYCFIVILFNLDTRKQARRGEPRAQRYPERGRVGLKLSCNFKASVLYTSAFSQLKPSVPGVDSTVALICGSLPSSPHGV